MFFLKKKGKKKKKKEKEEKGQALQGLAHLERAYVLTLFLKKKLSFALFFFLKKERQTTHHLIFLKFQPLWCPKKQGLYFLDIKIYFQPIFNLKHIEKNLNTFIAP
jgi:hypothetical protein